MPLDARNVGVDAGYGRVRRRLSRFANEHVVTVMVGVPVLVLAVLFVYPLFWTLYQSM